MKRVFVGNIPYDYDERSLMDTLEMVGPVDHFSIKYDKNTNKPKGFGFCDYVDEESASSALRNLKSIDYNGRQLRVNTAETDKNLVIENTDLTFFKETEGEIKMLDVMKGLSDEQKVLMFHTLRSLCDNDSENFKRLLMNQSEEFLEALLTAQNDFLNKITKSKNQVNKIIN
jgi:RNA recognition motif-containing protein